MFADAMSQACCSITMGEGRGAVDDLDRLGIVHRKREKVDRDELETCQKQGVGNQEDGELLLGLQLKLVQELIGHTDRVWGLAWSPVGSKGSKSSLVPLLRCQAAGSVIQCCSLTPGR